MVESRKPRKQTCNSHEYRRKGAWPSKRAKKYLHVRSKLSPSPPNPGQQRSGAALLGFHLDIFPSLTLLALCMAPIRDGRCIISVPLERAQVPDRWSKSWNSHLRCAVLCCRGRHEICIKLPSHMCAVLHLAASKHVGCSSIAGAGVKPTSNTYVPRSYTGPVRTTANGAMAPVTPLTTSRPLGGAYYALPAYSSSQYHYIGSRPLYHSCARIPLLIFETFASCTLCIKILL